MSKLITYEKDGVKKIQSIKLTDVKLSYPYLVAPRPKGTFGEGSYGSEFLIYDSETVELLNQYVKYLVAEALPGWGNKMPKNMTTPFRSPEPENNKNEEGALLVLKAKTFKNDDDMPEQPQLFIRKAGEKPRELTEEEIANYEITAGNIADAFVTLHAYTYQGKSGISAKVTAVCKTGEGTPVFSRPKINLLDEFSNGESTGFEEEQEEETNIEEVNLASLIKAQHRGESKQAEETIVPQKKQSAPVKQEEPAQPIKKPSATFSIDDLLKTK